MHILVLILHTRCPGSLPCSNVHKFVVVTMGSFDSGGGSYQGRLIAAGSIYHGSFEWW